MIITEGAEIIVLTVADHAVLLDRAARTERAERNLAALLALAGDVLQNVPKPNEASNGRRH
jgi:hypothetical protein